MMRRHAAAMLAMTATGLGPGLALGGCAGKARGGAATTPAPSATAEAETFGAADWRRVATPADRERMRRWRDAWVAGLAAVPRTAAREVAAQGVLFDPDAALPGAVPPAGDYRCRVFKLGRRGGAGAGSAGPGYVAYAWFACRVGAARADGTMPLVKLTGSQRYVGTLYPQDGRRAAFLGTLVLGDEVRTIDYGRSAERDIAGWVDRVGTARWRLAMPYPAFESVLDVMELVPAGG
ncbi:MULTISPECIES: DUF4893 domain-containing protein [Sphingomonas]|jgi:hypothetical protein|uniref:DUF4893 domain-containing protein n=1 Tax=Sphingomonas TaxID=13687 RepID=UPI0009E7C9D6|nr:MULTISPECIES: DUF4893 domain-containing protein [Sphingomonas]